MMSNRITQQVGVTVNRTARRIVDWQHKRRDIEQMDYYARSIAGVLPESRHYRPGQAYSKAQDMHSAFFIEYTHNTARQTSIMAFDGERLHDLSRTALMAMGPEPFKALYALLEAQHRHGGHLIMDTRVTPGAVGFGIEDVIDIALRMDR